MRNARRTAVGLLLSALLMIGCTREKQTGFLGSGTLEADEILLSSLLAGRVDSVLVREGDSVAKNQLLIVLDVDKLNVQLRQNLAMQEEATAKIQAAERQAELLATQHSNLLANLNRQRNLLKTGNSTQQIVDDLTAQEAVAYSRLRAAMNQVEALKARKEQLEAGEELIRLQMKDGLIAAPSTGTVIERYVDPGEIVAVGSPLVKIADLNRMKIRVYLSERDIGNVSLGTTVEVRVDALPDHPFRGQITWVSPRAEFTPRNVQTKESRADLVYAVEVTFNNLQHRALIGMPAEVYLKGEEG